MTIIQLAFLALAILATLFQTVKIAQIHALTMHHGDCKFADSLYVGVGISVFLQVLFVWSLSNL